VSEDEKTSLPWPTTWPGMYRFVTACFVVYVALLYALKVSFP
jgi:hypothetical protein